MQLQTNADRLVAISTIGEVTSPLMKHPFSTGGDGTSWVLPKYGGITYNVRVGDPACGWRGDHIEPGVSSKNGNHDANQALVQLACIGNDARVVSGQAQGGRGKVTGCHGGVDHCIIDFPPEVLESLAIGDRIQVKAYGQGLQISDQPDLMIMNCDPRLLQGLVTPAAGAVSVGVTAEIPAEWMGSDHGFMPPQGADFDICTTAPNARDYLNQVGLRLGDVVLVKDHWCEFGFVYYPGAVTVGVIVHCDSLYAGHGPGVRVIMTAKAGAAVHTHRDPDANIAAHLSRY